MARIHRISISPQKEESLCTLSKVLGELNSIKRHYHSVPFIDRDIVEVETEIEDRLGEYRHLVGMRCYATPVLAVSPRLAVIRNVSIGMNHLLAEVGFMDSVERMPLNSIRLIHTLS